MQEGERDKRDGVFDYELNAAALGQAISSSVAVLAESGEEHDELIERGMPGAEPNAASGTP